MQLQRLGRSTKRSEGARANLLRMGGVGLAALLLAGLLVACGAPSGPSVEAVDVWARPTMAMVEPGESSEGSMTSTGAVFMRLLNEGKEADRLVGGQTDVAEVVEIHETVIEGEVTKMQRLDGGLMVPARGEALLKPGGYHFMLIGMKRDLKVGDTFTMELQFEKSGAISVEPEVREP